MRDVYKRQILMLAVPVFGVIIYLLFGQSRVAKKMTQESKEVVKEIENYFKAVSYTHLDVYKRQVLFRSFVETIAVFLWNN